MRVLLLNQYFPPDRSATAYLVRDLAEDLAKNHHVEIIAGRPSYDPRETVTHSEFVSLRRAWSTSLPRASMAGRLLNYATFVVSAFATSITSRRPDVVVTFTDPPMLGVVGAIASVRFGVPLVYVCMDIFPDVAVQLGRIRNPFVVGAWRLTNTWIRRRSVSVVAIGRDMVEKLRGDGVPRSKLVLIPNWAEEPGATADRTATRERLGWATRRVVMHAGNVGLAQGLDVVIEAAHDHRSDPDVLYVILGEGAAKNHLEQRALTLGLSNVQFLAGVEKVEATDIMAAADLHVVSLQRGLKGCVVPSKVYGLLALGLPFVAAVDEGSEVARLINETGCGVVVAPGDGPALATAVTSLAREDLHAMGSQGRRIFAERYRRDIATSAYEKLLVQLVREPSPR